MSNRKTVKPWTPAYGDLCFVNVWAAKAGDADAQKWVVEEFCTANIQRAKAGDAKAGKWLLEQFCETVRNNRRTDSNGTQVPHNKPSGIHTQFHEELLDYVSDAFAKILAGVPPSKALGIVNESGRPTIEDKLDRAVAICDEILTLKQSRKYANMEQIKKQAIRNLQKEFPRITRATIDAGWKNAWAKAIAKQYPGANRNR